MEIVGTNMGFCVIEDFLWRTAADQLLQNKAVPEILSAGVQLAVGKGPGAALSELYVRFRVQNAGFPERIDTFLSLFCRFAALQNERTVAMLCENIGTKKSCRTASDNNYVLHNFPPRLVNNQFFLF